MIETSIIWISLCFSAFYLLGSFAFNLTSRTLNAPNFSVGSLVVIGAYIPLSSRILYGYEPYQCLVFSFIICAVTNWIVYRLIFKKILSYKRKPELVALASLAISILFRSLLNIWVYYLRMLTNLSPMTGFFKEFDFQIGVIRGVFLVSTMIAFSLFVLTRILYNAKIGLIYRSLFEDKTLAEIQGVNSSNLYSLIWLFSGGLAGLAGNLLPFISITSTQNGFMIQNSILAASILGGPGSIFGCFFGAPIVGVIEIVVTFLGQSYFGSWFGEYRFFISILIIAFILRFYPRGLKQNSVF